MVHADRVLDAKHLRCAEVGMLDNNALRQHHPWMHFSAGHGIFDGCRFNLQCVAGRDAHVDAVLLYHVQHRLGAVDGRPRPRENAPRATGVAFDQRGDRLPLAIISVLVDEYQGLAVAFVYRTWPVHIDRKVEPVECGAPVRPALHMPRPATFTLAVGGPRVKVTRTSVVAVARDQHGSLHSPPRRRCSRHNYQEYPTSTTLG